MPTSPANKKKLPPSKDELKKKHPVSTESDLAYKTENDLTKSIMNGLSDEEKKEILEAWNDKDIKAFNENNVFNPIQPCARKKWDIGCVPKDSTSELKEEENKKTFEKVKQGQTLDREYDITVEKKLPNNKKKFVKETKVRAGKNVKIDYAKILKWEGGNPSKAYVPWTTVWKKTTVDIGEAGSSHKKEFWLPDITRSQIKGSPVRAVPPLGNNGNNSGVTVGIGVDLGSKNDETYRRALIKANKESGILTNPEDVARLADKLKPYYGNKRLDACNALRKNPLDLKPEEVSLLNYESLMSHTDKAISNYEKMTGKSWNDLSEQEQTLLLSQTYHHGTMPAKLAVAVGNKEEDKVLALLKGNRKNKAEEREHDYMNDSYNFIYKLENIKLLPEHEKFELLKRMGNTA